MGFFDFFKQKAPDHATQLYGAVVAQARQPAFYTDLGVPDTVDGRFDVLIMHVTVLMRRLRQIEGGAGEALGQDVLTALFADMDMNLREMGIGDMSVGKHVKKMAKAFYGRAEVLEGALDGREGTDVKASLKDLVLRNVEPTEHQLDRLKTYLSDLDQVWSELPDERILAADLSAPTP